MKAKTLFIFLVAGCVSLSLGMWAYYSMNGGLKLQDLLLYVILFLIVGFAIYLGIRRLASEKRGEPGEDELSKRITQKAGATSYYVSLYLWLILSFFFSDGDEGIEHSIGLGIVGMALIFAISWFWYRIRGIKE